MRFYVFLVLSLSSAIGRAQNWALITPDELFSYKLGNIDVINHSVSAQSLIVSLENDSLFSMNRIIVPCLDCGVMELGSNCNGEEYFVSNRPDFLGSEIRHMANENWFLVGPDSILIKPQSPEETFWEFDPMDGIVATVDSVRLETIFGMEDSVKYISLSTGRRIELSRSFGIRRFPDFSSNDDFVLCGINGRDIGEFEPLFEEIFDFEVGDVLVYHSGGGSSMGGNNVLTRREVLSVEIEEDSVIMSLDQAYYGQQFALSGNFTWDMVGDYSGRDTIPVVIVKDDLMSEGGTVNSLVQFGEVSVNYYGEIEGVLSDLFAGVVVSRWELEKLEGRYMKYFNGNLTLVDFEGGGYGWVDGPIYDYCMDDNVSNEVLISPGDTMAFIAELSQDNRRAACYGSGLGVTFSGRWDGLSSYESRLIGFIKGGDTTGVIYGAEYLQFLAIENRSLSNAIFKVYPNPAQDMLNIEIDREIGPYEIIISDAMGRPMIHRSASQEVMISLDVFDLVTGIYLVNILSEHRPIYAMSFVKE